MLELKFHSGNFISFFFRLAVLMLLSIFFGILLSYLDLWLFIGFMEFGDDL